MLVRTWARASGAIVTAILMMCATPRLESARSAVLIILHTCCFHLSSGQVLSVQSCFIWPDLFLVFYQTCQHNTGGFHCDKCLTGFYGNATIGKPSDCKACPCPMTSPPNRLAWKREAGHNLPCSFRYRTAPSYCFLEFLARYDTRLLYPFLRGV